MYIDGVQKELITQLLDGASSLWCLVPIGITQELKG